MNISSLNSTTFYPVTETIDRQIPSSKNTNRTEGRDFLEEKLPLAEARKGSRVSATPAKSKNSNTIRGNKKITNTLSAKVQRIKNRERGQFSSINQEQPSSRGDDSHGNNSGVSVRKLNSRERNKSKRKKDTDSEKYLKVKEANYRYGTLQQLKNRYSTENIPGGGARINTTEVEVNNVEHLPADFVPSCLDFHDKEKAELQIKKMRQMQIDLPFCVSARACHAFEHFFTLPTAIRDEVIFALPVKEQLPEYSRIAEINKYRGIGQLADGVAGRNRTIGDNSIYSVMSISLLPNSTIVEREIYPENILPADSFKILQYQQLDGSQAFHFAYCVLSGDIYTEMNAGIIPVTKNNLGEFSLQDYFTGCRFTAKNINDLIEGLKGITGLSFSPGRITNSGDGSENRSQITTKSSTLFIGQEKVINGYDAEDLLINKNINVFSPAYYHPKDSDELLVLYRNTYAIRNNTVIYTSSTGEEGKLDFIPSASDGNKYRLSPPGNDNRVNYLSDLFSTEVNYTLPEIVSNLNNNSMSQLMDSKAIKPVLLSSNNTSFSIHNSIKPFTVDDLNFDYNKGEEGKHPCLSCFSIEGSMLKIVDDKGAFYQVPFVEDDFNPGFYQIDMNGKEINQGFLKTLNLSLNRKYQLVTIVNSMYGKGFIKVSSDDLSDLYQNNVGYAKKTDNRSLPT